MTSIFYFSPFYMVSIFDKMLQKHKIDDNVVKDLTEVVKKTGVKTTFDRHYYRFNYVHQADLLYLPEDDTMLGKHAKYLLVVVDIGSGKTDVRALAQRSANIVLKAIKEIYASKKYLTEPKRIQIDSGTEFSEFPSYFKNKNIGVRIAAVNRHKQGALVEQMNKQIGSTILKLQLNNEIASGMEDTAWVRYIDDILKLINEDAVSKHPRDLPILDELPKFTSSLCKGEECDLLMEGDSVRTKLDYPQSVSGKRLHGKFRSGDYRWSLTPSKIEKVLLFPNQPVRYVVSGFKNNTFAKDELKPYLKPKTKSKLTNNMFVIDKIVGKRNVKNKVEFLIQWEGYDESSNTWEPKTEIDDDLIKTYELSLKKKK